MDGDANCTNILVTPPPLRNCGNVPLFLPLASPGSLVFLQMLRLLLMALLHLLSLLLMPLLQLLPLGVVVVSLLCLLVFNLLSCLELLPFLILLAVQLLLLLPVFLVQLCAAAAGRSAAFDGRKVFGMVRGTRSGSFARSAASALGGRMVITARSSAGHGLAGKFS